MVDKSEKFSWIVRLGFAARGVVYILVGYLALTSAKSANGPEEALAWLRDAPLGALALYLSALGLVGYALFRLCSALFDIENYGNRATAVGQRLGHAASGVAHMLLAWTALQLAQGGAASRDGEGAREAAGTVMSLSFGWVVVGLMGLAFFLAGAVQAKKAVSASFMDRMADTSPSFVKPLGRAGYAARAVVFLVIGWSLVQSAWFVSTDRVRTLGGALEMLADHSAAYLLVAIGLLLFGLFSLFLARFRIVPDLERSDLRPKLS